MLSYEQILELMDKLVQSSLSEINLSEGEFSLSLKKEQIQQSSEQDLIKLLESLRSFAAAPAAMPMMSPVVAAPGASPIVESAVSEPVVPVPAANLLEVKSPMVGTFYAAASPDAAAFVEKGQTVKSGDVLGIIEAMKVMNELPSEVSGEVVEICVEDGSTVEYGQVLFRVKP